MATFIVRDSLESDDGGTGWDEEQYGPFPTEQAATEFAQRLASEGYTSHDGERRLVDVVVDVDTLVGEVYLDEGTNYSPDTPAHAMFAWHSDDNDDDTLHTIGPSEEERDRLRMADEDEDD